MESQPVRGATPELTGESDADLLVYMTMAESDLTCAQAAWEIFYKRHVEYLYRVCLQAYGDILGGEAGASDLVAEVFRTAYQNAHKFDPAGISDSQRLRLRTRAWLGWIARRMVLDILRSRGQLPMRNLELDHWQQMSEAGKAFASDSPMQQVVRHAIESLSEREQPIRLGRDLRLLTNWAITISMSTVTRWPPAGCRCIDHSASMNHRIWRSRKPIFLPRTYFFLTHGL